MRKNLLVFFITFTVLFFSQRTNAADWSSTVVDTANSVGMNTSLTIDTNGKIHIAYEDYTDNNVKYATNATGSWITSPVDITDNVGFWGISMALDATNNVHIAYQDETNGNLKYATNVSGAWIVTTIDNSSNDVGLYPSLVIDSNNKAHVAYLDETNIALKYATNLTGAWTTTTLDSGTLSGFFSSLAIDANNKLHISYYSLLPAALKYITNISGSWQITTLDTINCDYGTSLVVDNNNQAHISYYDSINKYLKYATNATGNWVYSAVDSSGDVGMYSSIAADANNKIFISYSDNTNKDLKYATNVAGSWVTTTLDSADSVGAYSAIKLDNHHRVHISYSDLTNNELDYIYMVGPSAPVLNIDTEDQYINDPAIETELLASGNPVQMMVSENSDFSGAAWEPYDTGKELTLSTGDGMKTVYAKFRDQWYAETDTASDNIYFDTTGPTVAASPAAGSYTNVQRVTLNADDGSGSGPSTIYYTTNGSPPRTTSSVYTVPITVTYNSDLKYFAVDNLGNTGSSATASYEIAKAKFVTKDAVDAEVLMAGKNIKYYANNIEFYFSDYADKFSQKKYYLEIKKFSKYPSNYQKVKKSALTYQWRIKTNMNKYSRQQDLNLNLIFRYTSNQYNKLKKHNSTVVESDLKLMTYNKAIKKWEAVDGQTISTGNNMISVKINTLKYKTNNFAIGL